MKYFFFALLFCTTSACSSLKKDNEPKSPPSLSDAVKEQLAVYRPLVAEGLDHYGLAVMDGSVGDSALFSCLARVGGAATFDPQVLFRDGKPLRHPDIAPSETPNQRGSRGTPISKDMVNGILWCIWDVAHKGDRPHALELTSELIAFGRSHKDPVAGWFFCTEEDRQAYQITDEDWLGKCLMPPSTIKDIYRMHQFVGGPCDDDCRYWTDVGFNLPGGRHGFESHLDVLTTTRNGLADGAINDTSLKSLQDYASSQPRNALFLAASHLFGDGSQEAAYGALRDESLFPPAHLPTASQYCTDYLFQRDQDLKDWVPCTDDTPAGPRGRGIDWIFAATVALGGLSP